MSQHHVYQKELYDQKVHRKPFSTGDWVWLYSPVVGKGGSHKLHCPWKGPYTVIKKISDVTYRIKNLQIRKDRQVVHFNRLKLNPVLKTSVLKIKGQQLKQLLQPNHLQYRQQVTLNWLKKMMLSFPQYIQQKHIGTASQPCQRFDGTHQEQEIHLSIMGRSCITDMWACSSDEGEWCSDGDKLISFFFKSIM